MPMPQIQSIDTEYKPWGGLAGIMTGEREAMQRAANLQGLEESMLGNAIKGVEANRAVSDYSDPRMEALRQQGIMGKNMSDSTKGQLDMGTLQSNIGATNAGNAAKQSESEIKNTINAMDRTIAMIQANGAGAGLAMVFPHMPPQLQEIAKQHPMEFPQILASLSEQLKKQLADSPAHRNKIEEVHTKGAYDLSGHVIGANASIQVGQGHDAATRYAADARRADVKAAENKFNLSIATASPEKRIGIVAGALNTRTHPYSGEPLSEEDLNKYQAIYDQDKRTLDARNAASSTAKIDIPVVAGMPAAKPPSVGGGKDKRPPLDSFNKPK